MSDEVWYDPGNDEPPIRRAAKLPPGKIGVSVAHSRTDEDKYCGENVYEGTTPDGEVLRQEIAKAREDERSWHIPGNSLTAPLSDYERLLAWQKVKQIEALAAHNARLEEQRRPQREHDEYLQAMAEQLNAEDREAHEILAMQAKMRMRAMGKPETGAF